MPWRPRSELSPLVQSQPPPSKGTPYFIHQPSGPFTLQVWLNIERLAIRLSFGLWKQAPPHLEPGDPEALRAGKHLAAAYSITSTTPDTRSQSDQAM